MKQMIRWLLGFCLGAVSTLYGQPALLEKELSQARSDTQKLRILTELHWMYLYENPSRARQLASQEIEMSKGKTGFEKQLAQGYNDLGLCEQVDFKWIEAIRWHELAFRIRKQTGDVYGQASSLSKIAVSYGEMGDYVRCLKYNLQALPLFEKLDNKPALARIYGNLAANYIWISQWPRADSLARLAALISKQLDDSLSMAQAWSLQAQILQMQGNIKGSVLLENQCLRIFENQKDTAKIIAVLNNLALDYGLMNQGKKSRDNYIRALALAEQNQSIYDQIQCSANLANKELELGNEGTALALLNKAEAQSLSERNHQFLPQIFRSWGFYWAKKGQALKANAYYMRASSLQDSLLSEKFASQYALYQTAYDLEKKARENAALNAESQMKSAHIARQRFWLAAGLFFFGLVLVVLFFAWRQHQFKIRQRLAAEKLAQQEKLAREILNAEEKERTRIARELHDGVGQQLVAAFLNLENLADEMPGSTRLEDAKVLVEDSLQEIRSVSHTMLSNTLLRSGLAGAVRDFVQKIKSPLSIHLEIPNLEHRLDATVELVLFRILQELVGNVIRHAKASEVFIQLFYEEGIVVLMVEDNGIGFLPGNQKNEGVGLRNIRSRTEFVGGSVEFDSRPGNGCMVVVRVPVNTN